MFIFIALLLIAPLAEEPVEVTSADAAWNQCIQSGLDQSEREASPRIVARQIAADCDATAQAMIAARTRWVESSDLSESEKRQALRALGSRVTNMTRMLEMMVRASRDD